MLFATVGCSYTRGERLFYHRYVEDDKLSLNTPPESKGRHIIPIFGQVAGHVVHIGGIGELEGVPGFD